MVFNKEILNLYFFFLAFSLNKQTFAGNVKLHTYIFIDRFRRSNDDVLGRAKKKTLWMTITIVIVFVVCWTPFYVMSVW